MALIVIQGEHAVIAAESCLMEDGVSADRAGDIVAFRLQFFDCRGDLIDFFPSEETVLAAVRVQARNSHGSFCHAESSQRLCALLDAALDVVFGNIIEHVAKGFVSCEEENTKISVCPMKGTSAAWRASLLIGVVATASAS